MPKYIIMTYISLCMRKLSLFFLVVLFAVGCNPDEIKPDPIIDYKGGPVRFIGKDGGQIAIIFTTNNEWSVSSSETWLTVSPSKGLPGESSVVAKASANPDYDLRSALVTITSGGIQTNVRVHQLTNEGVILPETTFLVESAGGKLKIPVKANIEYSCTVAEGCKDWITVIKVQTKGLEDYFLVLEVAENTGYDERVGQVKVAGAGEVEKEVTINQKGDPSQEIIVFEDSYAKSACVRNFDTNGDGEISIKEAAAVTKILSGFLTENEKSNIVNFNELQYFTGIKTIPEECFHGTVTPCRLERISIPESVTSIGKSAFSGCSSLTSISIPEWITSIGEYAFSSCSSLASITIPKGVTSITKGAFAYCSNLASISIREGITFIGDNVFSNCSSLASITIPKSVTSIGKSAFSYCSGLTGIFIPESVTSIGNDAFYGCSSLTSITIPEGVTFIGDYVFYNCSSLAGITIPRSVTSIGKSAFSNCSSLTSITVPEGVTSIGKGAFWGCTGLTGITIPEGITSIGESAFQYCRNLASVYCKSKMPPTGGQGVFSYNALYRKIYVPTGSVEAYKTAPYWSEYANSIIGYDF